MLTPEISIGLTISWVVTCGLVLFLVWRAARRDAQTQQGAEPSEATSHPTDDTDRAA